MKIFVITLFPEVIEPYLNSSIMKKAKESGVASFSLVGLRPFGLGKYKQVDDYPYGGGGGMILRPEPVFAAVDHVMEAVGSKPYTIVLTPQGKRFEQAEAVRLSKLESLLLICGHYEGMDERIPNGLADCEISIGDYVLTGGELPALVLIDAVVRLLKGVLPEKSVQDESFMDHLLEHPQYTRPAEFRGMAVPPVLLGGNHQEISKWRRENALRRTVSRSQALVSNAQLTMQEEQFVEKLKEELNDNASVNESGKSGT